MPYNFKFVFPTVLSYVKSVIEENENQADCITISCELK
jgi:hypothetical protein